jgi:hypothetical protein
MDYSKLLSNKWVWIGGGALGVVMLLSSRGGSSASEPNVQAIVANAAQMNQIGTAAAVEQNKIEASKAVEFLKANAAYSAQMLSYLGNESQMRAVISQQKEETRRAIGIAEIGASAARDIESQQTARAVSSAFVSGSSQAHVINAQGAAAAKVAKANKPSTGQLIVGGIGNAAKLAGEIGKFFF